MRNVAVVLIDGRQRTEVTFHTPLWEATMEWARFHGLDPMRIPAGSVVVRDAERYEIRYERVVEGEAGEPLVEDGELITRPTVERGEGPPLPFPGATRSA